jgi:hypothetical protein
MSRHHRHGRPSHPAGVTRPSRPAVPVAPAVEHPPVPAYALAEGQHEHAEPRSLPVAVAELQPEGPAAAPAHLPQPSPVPPAQPAAAVSPAEPVQVVTAPSPNTDDLAASTPARDGEVPRTTCTQAQLRRFIKSRPWVPMHELRRRFGIYGGDDDVTPVRMGATTVFVGLPTTEGRMLGELLVSGDVGYELSLDPEAPIVVGVYPMRPVPRG